jgi:hypothetical protein
MNSFIQPRQLVPDGFSLFITPDIEHIRLGSRFRFTLVFDTRMAGELMPRVGLLLKQTSPSVMRSSW